MKKRWQTDVCLILCGLLIWFLTDASAIRAAASEALTMCARSVIPALFPFFAVSSLLVSLGFGDLVSPWLSGLMGPLFRLPGHSSSALLLGLVGGYPIGAKTAADLYRQGSLTREEAERLLTFCNNSNPVFLISVLGTGVFASARTGLWLWLIHLVSALLTGILFRGGGRTKKRSSPPMISCKAVSFSSAFVESVRSAAMSQLFICAFVVLFYVLATPFAALGGKAGALLTGLTELFSMIPLLSCDHFSFVLAAGAAGWGGMSVFCQTAAVLDGSGLSLRPCLLGKLVQGGLSALLALAVSGYVLI